jgi:hypothetical protein
MAGRRGYPRFEIANAEGVLRVLHDVILDRSNTREVIAIATEPGLRGEIVTVHVAGERAGIKAKVVDSRPVIIDGAVRHRLRLTPVGKERTRNGRARRGDVREAE